MRDKRLGLFINGYDPDGSITAGASDVDAIYEIMTNPKFGQCDLSLSESYKNVANKTGFYQILDKFLKKINVNDQLVFYYSGHGKNKRGIYHFQFGSDDFSISTFISELTSNGINKAIIIIDSCFSGMITKGTKNNNISVPNNELLPQGIEIITSSSEYQVSYESNSLSIFTDLFCQCIKTGNNKTPTPDNYINATDIIQYFKNNNIHKDQTPQHYTSGADSIIWIAKNISINHNSIKITALIDEMYEDIKQILSYEFGGIKMCLITIAYPMYPSFNKYNFHLYKTRQDLFDTLKDFGMLLSNSDKYNFKYIIFSEFSKNKTIFFSNGAIVTITVLYPYEVITPDLWLLPLREDSLRMRNYLHKGLLNQSVIFRSYISNNLDTLPFEKNDVENSFYFGGFKRFKLNNEKFYNKNKNDDKHIYSSEIKSDDIIIHNKPSTNTEIGLPIAKSLWKNGKMENGLLVEIENISTSKNLTTIFEFSQSTDWLYGELRDRNYSLFIQENKEPDTSPSEYNCKECKKKLVKEYSNDGGESWDYCTNKNCSQNGVVQYAKYHP